MKEEEENPQLCPMPTRRLAPAGTRKAPPGETARNRPLAMTCSADYHVRLPSDDRPLEIPRH